MTEHIGRESDHLRLAKHHGTAPPFADTHPAFDGKADLDERFGLYASTDEVGGSYIWVTQNETLFVLQNRRNSANRQSPLLTLDAHVQNCSTKGGNLTPSARSPQD